MKTILLFSGSCDEEPYYLAALDGRKHHCLITWKALSPANVRPHDPVAYGWRRDLVTSADHALVYRLYVAVPLPLHPHFLACRNPPGQACYRSSLSLFLSL